MKAFCRHKNIRWLFIKYTVWTHHPPCEVLPLGVSLSGVGVWSGGLQVTPWFRSKNQLVPLVKASALDIESRVRVQDGMVFDFLSLPVMWVGLHSLFSIA